MKFSIVSAALTLTMLTAPGVAAANASAPEAGAPAVAAASKATADPAFVPADFDAPTSVETPGFKLVPLGPELVRLDFEAYMSSIEHLQATFTRSTAWPRQEISDADAMRDMLNEQSRFASRSSFAYAVLTPDGRRERGCVYVYPSPVSDYDAEVTMWVTKAEFDAGFDAELFAWVAGWMATAWPFANVAYPGRSIEWGAWDSLVAANGPGKPASGG